MNAIAPIDHLLLFRVTLDLVSNAAWVLLKRVVTRRRHSRLACLVRAFLNVESSVHIIIDLKQYI